MAGLAGCMCQLWPIVANCLAASPAGCWPRRLAAPHSLLPSKRFALCPALECPLLTLHPPPCRLLSSQTLWPGGRARAPRTAPCPSTLRAAPGWAALWSASSPSRSECLQPGRFVGNKREPRGALTHTVQKAHGLCVQHLSMPASPHWPVWRISATLVPTSHPYTYVSCPPGTRRRCARAQPPPRPPTRPTHATLLRWWSAPVARWVSGQHVWPARLQPALRRGLQAVRGLRPKRGGLRVQDLGRPLSNLALA